MTAFATYADLGVRMKRTFTEAEQPWVTALLEDAAEIMRGVMRNHVYPSRQIEYVAYPTGGRVDLPFDFITSIDSVKRDGVDVEYSRFEDTIDVDSSEAVSITVTSGLSEPPGDLVSINCALVSGAMLTVEAGLGLTAGGMSSVAIDDFKAAWADAGEMSGMALSGHSRKHLESRYGRSAWVVETRR